jgi:CRP/FNR family transcriptional regulator
MKSNMLDTELQSLKIQILKNLELFDDLSDDELIELAHVSEVCHLEKGTIIYRQGNNPEYIYIINQGKIKSFSLSLSGRLVIANVSQDLIGLQNIVSGEPLWVSAEVMDATTALKVHSQDFIAFIKQKPLLILRILKRAEKTMTCLFNRLNVLADCSAEQRVIDGLYGLYEKFGLMLPFRMAEMAGLAGLTRETTIRVMSRLKKQGIIKSVRSGIVILDIDRLRILKQYSPLM